VPLNILKSDNLSLIEEFLQKKIRSRDEVNALIAQT
jgi:hypothetical protein